MCKALGSITRKGREGKEKAKRESKKRERKKKERKGMKKRKEKGRKEKRKKQRKKEKWQRPVMPVTWEAESGSSTVQVQPRQKVRETSHPNE
jgi:hypothetical protein